MYVGHTVTIETAKVSTTSEVARPGAKLPRTRVSRWAEPKSEGLLPIMMTLALLALAGFVLDAMVAEAMLR